MIKFALVSYGYNEYAETFDRLTYGESKNDVNEFLAKWDYKVNLNGGEITHARCVVFEFDPSTGEMTPVTNEKFSRVKPLPRMINRNDKHPTSQ
jgi:hypothetical protein